MPSDLPDDTRTGSVVRVGAAVGMSDDRLPFVLLGWTYFSSVLANLVFFGRPAVALAGGLGMGAILACALLRTARPRRFPHPAERSSSVCGNCR